MKIARTAAALALAVLTLAAAAWGQVPEKMNYQVMLTDNSDQPLADESVELVFRIYNVDTGGTSLWTETHNVVTNSIGVVSVVLGTYNPLSLAFEGPLWLQVAVDGEIMSPRRELTSAPYALNVGAGSSGDGHSLDADDGSPVDAVYVDADGIVEFGSSTSDGKAEFHAAGSENPSIKLHAESTYGGKIELYEESGAQYGGLEPDFDGTGGFLWIDNGSGGSGAYIDGNAVAGNTQVGIYGTASSTYFNTYNTGDDAVQLPASAVSSPEILDEAGAARIATATTVDLTGPIQSILLRTIIVPAPGYVLVMCTLEPRAVHSGGIASSASFGVSSSGTEFPYAGAMAVRIPDTVGTGIWFTSLTVQGLFEVDVAGGAYTFHLLAEEAVGSWTVFDRNMTLVYLPTSYGLSGAAATAHPTDQESEAATPGLALTEADIAAERAESVAFNNARIERELAEIRAEIAEMRANMDNGNKQ